HSQWAATRDERYSHMTIPTIDLSRVTLLDALDQLPRCRERGVTFYDGRGRPRGASYAELWGRALRFASGLRRRGLRPGEPVILILPDPEEAIIAILGAIAAGCPPAPIYPPVSAPRVP